MTKLLTQQGGTNQDSSLWTGLVRVDAGVWSIETGDPSHWEDAYDKRVDTWTGPLVFASNTASITKADTSTDGYLSSTDWNTFNDKVAESTTVSDTDTIDLTLTGYDITGIVKTDSINDTHIDWGTLILSVFTIPVIS